MSSQVYSPSPFRPNGLSFLSGAGGGGGDYLQTSSSASISSSQQQQQQFGSVGGASSSQRGGSFGSLQASDLFQRVPPRAGTPGTGGVGGAAFVYDHQQHNGSNGNNTHNDDNFSVSSNKTWTTDVNDSILRPSGRHPLASLGGGLNSAGAGGATTSSSDGEDVIAPETIMQAFARTVAANQNKAAMWQRAWPTSEAGTTEQQQLDPNSSFSSTGSSIFNSSSSTSKEENTFQAYSFKEIHDDVKSAAKAMIALGLQPKESVNILGVNSVEWTISFLGCIYAGGIPAGIYPQFIDEVIHYQADITNAALVVVDSSASLQRYLRIRDQLPKLRAIVQFGPPISESLVENAGARLLNRYNSSSVDVSVPGFLGVFGWNDFLALGGGGDYGRAAQAAIQAAATRKNFTNNNINLSSAAASSIALYMQHQDNVSRLLDARISSQTPGDCAAIVFTPATSGNPKAVMLSHDNLLWSASAVMKKQLQCSNSDSVLSVVTHVCHMTLVMELFGMVVTGLQIFFPRIELDDAKNIFRMAQAVKPTIFVSIPYGWNKMASLITSSVLTPPLRERSYEIREQIVKKIEISGGNPPPIPLLVNLRSKLGFDRIKFAGTFSSLPLLSTLIFFHSISLPLHNFFGFAESSGPQTLNVDHLSKLTSAGKCLKGGEIAILGPKNQKTGEILIRGRNVMMGYLKNEEATRESIDSEGYFHSGDLGAADEKGFISVFGPMSSTVKLGGGNEIVLPWIIERTCVDSLPPLSHTLVVGDNLPFLSALLTLKTRGGGDALDLESQLFSLSHSLSLKTVDDATSSSSFQRLVSEGIALTNKIHTSKQVKKFVMLSQDFSRENGDLNPMFKMRRAFIQTQYAGVMQAIYGPDIPPPTVPIDKHPINFTLRTSSDAAPPPSASAAVLPSTFFDEFNKNFNTYNNNNNNDNNNNNNINNINNNSNNSASRPPSARSQIRGTTSSGSSSRRGSETGDFQISDSTVWRLADGTIVYPAEIESSLLRNIRALSQVVVVGEGREGLGALITLKTKERGSTLLANEVLEAAAVFGSKILRVEEARTSEEFRTYLRHGVLNSNKERASTPSLFVRKFVVIPQEFTEEKMEVLSDGNLNRPLLMLKYADTMFDEMSSGSPPPVPRDLKQEEEEAEKERERQQQQALLIERQRLERERERQRQKQEKEEEMRRERERERELLTSQLEKERQEREALERELREKIEREERQRKEREEQQRQIAQLQQESLAGSPMSRPCGIGIGLSPDRICPPITKIIAGGSADLCGDISAGDVILSVNGETVRDRNGSQVGRMLLGPPGSMVLLTLQRGNRIFSVHLRRLPTTTHSTPYDHAASPPSFFSSSNLPAIIPSLHSSQRGGGVGGVGGGLKSPGSSVSTILTPVRLAANSSNSGNPIPAMRKLDLASLQTYNNKNNNNNNNGDGQQLSSALKPRAVEVSNKPPTSGRNFHIINTTESVILGKWIDMGVVVGSFAVGVADAYPSYSTTTPLPPCEYLALGIEFEGEPQSRRTYNLPSFDTRDFKVVVLYDETGEGPTLVPQALADGSNRATNIDEATLSLNRIPFSSSPRSNLDHNDEAGYM